MPVIEDLSEEECYLLAILTDTSGLDLAEWCWFEPDTTVSPDGCWRAWPFQWAWYRSEDPLQIDQCARSVGKTMSITVRSFAFPFLFPGQEMVLTAPELVHLEPLTQLIEQRFQDTRLGREISPGGRSAVTHRPFMMRFVNGARESRASTRSGWNWMRPRTTRRQAGPNWWRPSSGDTRGPSGAPTV